MEKLNEDDNTTINAVWRSLSERQSEIESDINLFKQAKRKVIAKSAFFLGMHKGAKGKGVRFSDIKAISTEIFTEEEKKIHNSLKNAYARYNRMKDELENRLKVVVK